MLRVVDSRVDGRLDGGDEEICKVLRVLVELDGALDATTGAGGGGDISESAELDDAVEVDRIEACFDDQGANE